MYIYVVYIFFVSFTSHLHRIYSVMMVYSSTMEDTDKGGLTQFLELFTVIPCAPKDLKH